MVCIANWAVPREEPMVSCLAFDNFCFQYKYIVCHNMKLLFVLFVCVGACACNLICKWSNKIFRTDSSTLSIFNLYIYINIVQGEPTVRYAVSHTSEMVCQTFWGSVTKNIFWLSEPINLALPPPISALIKIILTLLR